MAVKKGITVVQSPMGTGKSTYLMVMLASITRQRITIVLPNIRLAKSIRDEITAALKRMRANEDFAKYIPAEINVGHRI